jgi:hypothetical protein
MTSRLLSFSIVGALALSAFPAFAEDAAISSESSSVSTSAASAASVSSASSKLNLGQRIKEKCHKLNGKSRVLCLDETKLTDRKLAPSMMMKKVVKKMVKKNCNDYTKGSDEFKTCVSEQKEIGKEQSPKTAKMMKKMMENKRGKGSSSSAS